MINPTKNKQKPLTFLPKTKACGDDTDTTLNAVEMQSMIETMTLNMQNYPSVNGSPVLTEDSVLTPDWSNVQSIPADLDDGDDDTQLSEGEVEGYVTNGSIDLADGSTMGGNGLVTDADLSDPDWGDVLNRPVGLDDGDDDVLGGISCLDGEYPIYDAGVGTWLCEDTVTLEKIDASAATAGQVLSFDGNAVGWGDDAGGEGCEVVESIISSPVRHRMQCGSTTFIVEGSTLAATALADEAPWTYDHHCAINTSGGVKCWGYDWAGQVSDSPSGTFTSLSSGRYHTCWLLGQPDGLRNFFPRSLFVSLSLPFLGHDAGYWLAILHWLRGYCVLPQGRYLVGIVVKQLYEESTMGEEPLSQLSSVLEAHLISMYISRSSP